MPVCVWAHVCVHIVWRENNVQIKDSEDEFSLTKKLVFLIPLINQSKNLLDISYTQSMV